VPNSDHPGTDDDDAFAGGLLNPDMLPPRALKGASARYDVYRNNVTVSLIQVLADIYPAVKRITGDAFFRAMARIHVRATPPTSPLLFDYGRAFPDFIARYEYAQQMPWLADVARIERAWLDAFHAADAPTLCASALAAVSPEVLGNVVLSPHPATRIVRSAFPALSVFAANRSDNPVGPIAAREGEDVLIARPGMAVIVRHLPPGGAEFLSRLMRGEPLAAAAGAAYLDSPSFDLAPNIAGMLEAGAFSAIQQARKFT
jgi:hypothetical protein